MFLFYYVFAALLLVHKSTICHSNISFGIIQYCNMSVVWQLLTVKLSASHSAKMHNSSIAGLQSTQQRQQMLWSDRPVSRWLSLANAYRPFAVECWYWAVLTPHQMDRSRIPALKHRPVPSGCLSLSDVIWGATRRRRRRPSFDIVIHGLSFHTAARHCSSICASRLLVWTFTLSRQNRRAFMSE